MVCTPEASKREEVRVLDGVAWHASRCATATCLCSLALTAVPLLAAVVSDVLLVARCVRISAVSKEAAADRSAQD